MESATSEIATQKFTPEEANLLKSFVSAAADSNKDTVDRLERRHHANKTENTNIPGLHLNAQDFERGCH